MWFKNISHFNDTRDYLPILTAALIVDMIVLLRMVAGYIHIKSLTQWYNKFGFMAVVADVLSIVIGVILARALYSLLFKEYSWIGFLALTCLIQLTHDLLFARFFYSVPRHKNRMLDVFKDYGNEVGVQILFVDALMMISTVLLGSFLATCSTNTNIIVLIVCMYILPYLLF
jgi:uncharacterized protein YacL